MTENSSAKKTLDSLITAVMVLDDQLLVREMNAAAEALLCTSVNLMKARSVDACFLDREESPFDLNTLSLDTTYTKRKARWKLHNHQVITVDYSVTPSPELGHMIVEMQPIDRLLRISREEALLSSQETSKNLVRSMAHEIKNPLGGIRGAAQLLERELNDPELHEYTNVIIQETDRLRNLVDRMLGPDKPCHQQQINIHEVVERVSTIIKMEAKASVSVVRDYDPSIPDIAGDAEQLQQAVLNIARNAMQALLESAHEQASIRFVTRVQRRHTIGNVHHPLVARLSIIDNGPGIPPALIKDIFFPMITGRAEGTGLGLAISQNIIGQHKGLIECDSEAGKTEFTVYLPLGNHYA